MHLRQKLIWAIGIFAVMGLALSAYSTYTHYDTNVHEFCSINETFDCDVVNKSKYSELFGIPVAVLGVGGYLFFLAAIIYYSHTKDERLMALMAVAAVVGFGFSLYLTYIEAFVLYTWCLICIGQALCMTAVFVGVFWLRKIDAKKPALKDVHESS